MDPFLGEIRLLPFTFAPRGWALCQGQLIPIRQNTALFALLGTQYGGDGSTTFALPDLRGRAVVGKDQGPGLTNYAQGAMVGTENVTLLASEMPAHVHNGAATGTIPVSVASGTQNSPAGGYFSATTAEQYGTADTGNDTASMLSGTATAAGGSQPHENRMPFLTLNYCIALQGIFPPRP